MHILRLLIDGLIPGQSRLLREPGHRLDQLIDLRAQQRLAVPGLNRLDPIVPVKNTPSEILSASSQLYQHYHSERRNHAFVWTVARGMGEEREGGEACTRV